MDHVQSIHDKWHRLKSFIENEKIPELPFVPRTLLFQGSWGEIWRATHETVGNVLFVAYSSGEGEEVFSASQAGLKNWQRNVGPTAHRLLKIIEISEGAIPYLLVEDTGEKTLAESLENHHGKPSLEALAKVVKEIALAVGEAEEWGLSPIGLAPEFVMKCSSSSSVPWKLLPVAPGAPLNKRSAVCGKYLPPSTLGGDLSIDPQNCDTYALGAIWMDLIRMYQRDASDLEKRILLESGLKESVAGCLQKVEGEFRPPSEVADIAQHWLTRFHRKKDEITARVSAPEYVPDPDAPMSGDENILAQFSTEEEHTMILPSRPVDPDSRNSTAAIPIQKVNFEGDDAPNTPALGQGDLSDEPTLLPDGRRTVSPVDPQPAKPLPAPNKPVPEAPRPPIGRSGGNVPGSWVAPESYEIIETLGSGSMARVYKAKHKVLDRVVVLKVSTPKPGAGIEENPQRLLLEARTVAKLEHENIVRINDCFIHMGHVHLVMEYVDGMTLGDLLKIKDPSKLDVKYRRMLAAPGRLRPDRAMEFGMQMASALEYAHKHGIIHRDVKPTNLLVTPDGKAKLFDFSIAKIQAGEVESMTATGIILGSPAYMSPEQVERQPLDGRADIYALGCVLYHAATGRPPFSDKSDVMLCLKQLKEQAPAPHEILPEVPEDFSRIITRCLYKDRTDRFGSGHDLELALKRIRDLASFNAGPEKPRPLRPATKEPIPQKGAITTPREPQKQFDPIITRTRQEDEPSTSGSGIWLWIIIVLIIAAAAAYYFFIR